MDPKYLFRPTFAKIIVMINSYLVLSLIFPIIPAVTTVMCKAGIHCPPVLFFSTLTRQFTNNQYFVGVNYTILIIELVLFYFVSCSVVYLYDIHNENISEKR